MRHIKHIGLVAALLIAGVAAGITGTLIFPFIALHAYLLARLAGAFFVYEVLDKLFFHEWNTANELLKGNIGVAVFNSALLLAIVASFIWGI